MTDSSPLDDLLCPSGRASITRTRDVRAKAVNWRAKMRKAGVCDVLLPPKATKLTEREVDLVNAAFGRLTVEPTSLRIAA